MATRQPRNRWPLSGLSQGRDWKTAVGDPSWDNFCDGHIGGMLTSLMHMNGEGTAMPTLIIRPTLTPRSFTIVTCINCGCDYCGAFLHGGCFSPVETLVFHEMLKDSCGPQQDGLVVDVGGNVGYFTNLAVAYGCRVVAFEPQREPARLAQATVLFNRFCGQVKWVPTGVGPSINVTVPEGNNAWWVGGWVGAVRTCRAVTGPRGKGTKGCMGRVVQQVHVCFGEVWGCLDGRQGAGGGRGGRWGAPPSPRGNLHSLASCPQLSIHRR